jgi:uncharacterized membrane protein YkoI
MKTLRVLVLVAAAAMTASASIGIDSLGGKKKAEPPRVKLSRTDAMAAATAKIGGTALRAKLTVERRVSLYEVMVRKDGKLFEVEVDASTGRIIQVEQEDDDDDDDDEDEDDDDDEEEDDD